MQKTSLIPSFEKIELHSIDLTAEKIVNTLNEEVQAFRTLANPLLCDEKYLPFLAYAYKVDFWDDRLSTDKKRLLIKDSILLHQKKGTLWALERILEILEVKAEISEWFNYGGDPYYFKIKLSIEQEFPYLNQLQKIISIYKNVRSLFEIDFDLFLKTPFTCTSATNTRLEIQEDIYFNKEVSNIMSFGLNYDYEPFEVIHIEKDLLLGLASSNITDIEVDVKGFNVDRDTAFNNLTGLIANLHFGDINSDVMHLPIPPIKLSTSFIASSNVILNIGFEQESGRDLFNLTQHINYEAETLINFLSSSSTGIDFSNNGLNSTIKTKTNINNICLLNLNI